MSHSAIPFPTNSALLQLYAAGWTDDGVTARSDAVEQRLTAIVTQFADDWLKANVSSPSPGSPGGSGSGVLDAGAAAATTLDEDCNIVIFNTALSHVARITRILSMEGGHLILMGPPGCGRRTMARLACFMSRCAVFEAGLKDGQRGLNWREMLKSMMHTAGVQGR